MGTPFPNVKGRPNGFHQHGGKQEGREVVGRLSPRRGTLRPLSEAENPTGPPQIGTAWRDGKHSRPDVCQR